MIRGLLVVGTDTGVGKTFVASSIVKALVRQGLRVGALKPLATGAVRTPEGWFSEDVESLRAALDADTPRERVASLIYEQPLAPCVAARLEGRTLTESLLEQAVCESVSWWEEHAEVLVVEGVGGFLCPLSETTTLADLAVKLDYPLIVVARRSLGTLSHTLMTIEAARYRGLRVAGVILNSATSEPSSLAESTNAHEVSRRIPGVSILAEIPHGDLETLHGPFGVVDWNNLAKMPRMIGESEPRIATTHNSEIIT